MRRTPPLIIVLVFALVALVGWTTPTLSFEPSQDFSERLEGINDPALRTTLENSLEIGLIADRAEFEAAVQRARLHERDNPAASGPRAGQAAQQIAKLAAELASLDQDAAKVTMVYGQGDRLFAKLSGSLPAGYEKAVTLARRFNPKVGTYDTPTLNTQVDAYLQSISDDPCIKYALSVTRTTMADLKANWFGRGNGFEHVFDGEIKGGEVSGYHFWYKFYSDEQAGNTHYASAVNSNDPCMFTGSFKWDPDGNGPMPNANKRKGGFLVGNSAAALLALGQIAIETARQVSGQTPSALNFQANINGRNYNWQLYTMNNCIRSMYPIVGATGQNFSLRDSPIREYYNLEEGTR